ncbi:MAG TPA: hypothetical protein VGM25_10730 [Caulobacteraceae bacterium]|jgi:hypothetical protein
MLILMLAAGLTAAPTPSPVPANPCNPAESCRYIDEFPVKDAQGQSHTVQVKRWLPYLLNGRLTLFPGEVVSVSVSDKGPAVTAATVLTAEDRDSGTEALAAQVQKETLQNGKEQLKAVPRASANQTFLAEKDSLRLAFLQTGQGDMMLRIASGYGGMLTYKAGIVRPGAKGPSPTSVCSVVALKTGIETWPPPIVAIELSDFKVEASEAVQPVCR